MVVLTVQLGVAVALTVVYALLTIGWLLHVVMNMGEATKMHVLIALLPLIQLISSALAIGVPTITLSDTTIHSNAFYIASQIDAGFFSGVFFLVLGLAASGYCYIPAGMVQGRLRMIIVLSIGNVVLAQITLFTSPYAGSLIFLVFLFEMFLLSRWSTEVVDRAHSLQHATQHHHEHELWTISSHHRLHVAQGVRRSVIVYIIANIIQFAIGFAQGINAFIVGTEIVSSDGSRQDIENDPRLQSLITVALVASLAINLSIAVVLIFLMMPFRMTRSADVKERAMLINPEAAYN